MYFDKTTCQYMNSQISELIFNIKMQPVFSVTGRHRNLDNNMINVRYDITNTLLAVFDKDLFS